ncbi:MAG: hypothetical protein KDB82_16015 [Planctomycetes bacterium]|nr:hypothetical protein [Planctomycetota bacterium]
MKKVVPFVILAVLGTGLGLLIWWAFREKPVDNPGNTEPEMENLDFVAADFLPTFDINEDLQVTFDEFKERYGKGPLIFHEENGGPALSAEQAFKRWDRDQNGVVDHEDLKLIDNKAWAAFQAQAEKRGLRARDWNGRYLMLNEHQDRTYETELGALKRKEVPYAGRYWKPKYLASWVRVVTPKNETVEGYGSHNNGKLFLLTPDAKLSVYDEDEVMASDLGPDTPQMQYARGITSTPFDDTQGNLELAKKCAAWGMAKEAGMLCARVLVFDPHNEAALKALGYRLEGDRFIEDK